MKRSVNLFKILGAGKQFLNIVNLFFDFFVDILYFLLISFHRHFVLNLNFLPKHLDVGVESCSKISEPSWSRSQCVKYGKWS